MNVRVANAPVSYGAFEITVGRYPNVPDANDVLDFVADAGYVGIDLGPLGYLGEGPVLAERLASHNLQLAGAYLQMPFSQANQMEESLPDLDRLLDILDEAAADGDATFRPRPTLADAGGPARDAAPGMGQRDRSLGLDQVTWQQLAQGVKRAVSRCRERGYEPTFHHHTATYVEAPWEIERLLEITDVGLCLDTGHLLLSDGDPVAAVRNWGSRINHVHIKDAHQGVIDRIVDQGSPLEEIWTRQAFCPLGEGDVDVDAVLQGLRDIDFEGWLVVEQDQIPDPAVSKEEVAAQQVANREYLRARGV
jgi:inosose dehydratase